MNIQNRIEGVIVLGPYRSGTSIASKILSSLGVTFGPAESLFSGSKFNPYGYFERDDINDFNNRLIESAGGSLEDPLQPPVLAERCDRELASHLDTDWLFRSPYWGIKDPRMCATLYSWLELGLLDKNRICIVQVVRNLDDATISGLKHQNILHYCDGTEEGVRNMLLLYADLAQWHVDKLRVPTHQLRYDGLLANPQDEIDRLANFVGLKSSKRLKAAYRLVGKTRALRKYYLHRLFVRAPRKLYRFLMGIQ